MVRMKGLEPSHPCEYQNLNLARLPIPPHPHIETAQKVSHLRPNLLYNITMVLEPESYAQTTNEAIPVDSADTLPVDAPALAVSTSESCTKASQSFIAPGILSHKAAQTIGHIFFECTTATQYVYFAEATGLRRVKIGFSARDPIGRVMGQQTSCPGKLRLLCIIRVDGHIESMLHDVFRQERVHGEWFKFSKRIKALIEVLRPVDLLVRKSPFVPMQYAVCTVISAASSSVTTDSL